MLGAVISPWWTRLPIEQTEGGTMRLIAFPVLGHLSSLFQVLFAGKNLNIFGVMRSTTGPRDAVVKVVIASAKALALGFRISVIRQQELSPSNLSAFYGNVSRPFFSSDLFRVFFWRWSLLLNRARFNFAGLIRYFSIGQQDVNGQDHQYDKSSVSPRADSLRIAERAVCQYQDEKHDEKQGSYADFYEAHFLDSPLLKVALVPEIVLGN